MQAKDGQDISYPTSNIEKDECSSCHGRGTKPDQEL